MGNDSAIASEVTSVLPVYLCDQVVIGIVDNVLFVPSSDDKIPNRTIGAID
jgi:hypothetical protein